LLFSLKLQLVLCDAARQYIASETSHAIFFIRVREVDEINPNQLGRLALTRLLEHEEFSESSDIDDTWNPRDKGTTTGFAVRRYEGNPLILTTAHIIRLAGS
jgi:hypothetical protein